MKLPGGDRALVEDGKLLGYVLNPDHPIGRHHALLFDKLLGVDRTNAVVLREALLRAAENEEVLRDSVTPFGRKYQMRFELCGPLGTKQVIAVWITEHGQDRPRLVTCYVE
jgi:hypothetical protein